LLPHLIAILASSLLLSAQEAGIPLLKQAQANLNAGHYAEAIKLGTAAADQFRRAKDQSNLIRAITAVGLADMYSGDYPTALKNFVEARDLSRSRNDLAYEITSLNNIGTVQYFTGRYSEAMDAYRAAQALVDSAPSAAWLASRRQLTSANTAILYQTLGQNDRALAMYNGLLNTDQALSPREKAQLLANVGVLRRRLGDPHKALDTYRAAQELYRQAGHRDGEISVLNNIGILQAMDFKDYRSAASTFTSALKLAQEAGDRPLIIHARLYRGEAYFRDGHLHESVADFQTAATEAEEIGAPEEQWKAEFGLARSAIGLGEKSRGVDLLKSAVRRIESLRAGLTSSSLRSAFLVDRRDVYDLLIENTNEAGAMFTYMEQSRGRGLLDRVRPSGPRSLPDTVRDLPANAGLIEYWIGRSSAAAIWAFHGEVGVARLDLTPELRRAIAATPRVLADPARTDWADALAPLSKALLGGVPVLNDPRMRRLIVVPDGPLAAVPFEALPFGDRLLIERFTIAYVPAAGLVAARHDQRGLRWFWQTSLEALADPAPSGGNKPELPSSAGFARLPNARREIEGIATALGGRDALYFDAAAIKQRLFQSAGAPVLHLATHAFADMENPELSYILLAPSAASQRYDYLFLKEVGDLPLAHTRLVTLSACDTGVGRDLPGEGIESFSRAFLSAGVPSVVTSLWAVPDRATSELMTRFYSRLAGGEPLADALRNAKLDFLHSPAARHPSNWAAFVLNGDGDARLPYVVRLVWVLVPAALILTVLAIAAFRRRAGTALPSLASRHPTDRESGHPTAR
jgi:tetratricopeptide (TPR) repeat protein